MFLSNITDSAESPLHSYFYENTFEVSIMPKLFLLNLDADPLYNRYLSDILFIYSGTKRICQAFAIDQFYFNFSYKK